MRGFSLSLVLMFLSSFSAEAYHPCARELIQADIPLKAELALAKELWPFVATYPFVDDIGREVLVVFSSHYPLSKKIKIPGFQHQFSLAESGLILLRKHPDFYFFKEKDFRKIWRPEDFSEELYKQHKAQTLKKIRKITGCYNISDAEIEKIIKNSFAKAWKRVTDPHYKPKNPQARDPAILEQAQRAFSAALKESDVSGNMVREFAQIGELRGAKYIMLPFFKAPPMADFKDFAQREISTTIHLAHLQWAIEVMHKLGYQSLIGREIKRLLQEKLRDPDYNSPDWAQGVAQSLQEEFQAQKHNPLRQKILQMAEVNPYQGWPQYVANQKFVW
ncbi:MAG: hypothetical protein J6Y94_03465 [Bacteriovoracaceae bacterium]|nr:hypothetical protein [Bacteriovoracaceae bacterium]